MESLFRLNEQVKQTRMKALFTEWETEEIPCEVRLIKRVIPYVEKLLEEKEEGKKEEKEPIVEPPPPPQPAKQNKRMSIMQRVSIIVTGKGESNRNLNEVIREVSGDGGDGKS